MEDTTLLQAIKEARTQQAARLEAVFHVRDLRSLRLMELRDALLSQGAGGNPLFDLTMESGDTPRLWLGPSVCVAMEPDPRSYRLMDISAEGQGVILQTSDVKAVQKAALKQMALDAVSYSKPPARAAWHHRKFSFLELALASLLGLALGLVVCGLWALQAGFLRWR